MRSFPELRGSRVLVTGGAGFVGSHLTEALVRNGAQVDVVDRLMTGSPVNLNGVIDQINLIVGDFRDMLRENQLALGSYDTIFHLAGNAYIPPSVENPLFDFEVNLVNTLMLLEALRHIEKRPHLVLASTAAVYGNPVKLPVQETDFTDPISPYGVSKLASERYLAVYARLYGVRATTLRFFSMYGPRQRKQVVYDLLAKLRATPDAIEVYGDGLQVRDLAYIEDVVQALCVAALYGPATGEVYNVGSGDPHSIREIVDTWCRVLEISPDIHYTGSVRPGDSDKWIVDVSKLRGIGFEPAFSLEEGMRRTRDWYDAEAKS